MKKISKLFSLILLLVITLTLTSCMKGDTFDKVELKKGDTVLAELKPEILEKEEKENLEFIGYLVCEDYKTYLLYLEGSVIKKDVNDAEAIYIPKSKIVNEDASFPTVKKESLAFAGWYIANFDEQQNVLRGSRIATFKDFESKDATLNDPTDNILVARYLTFGDASLVALVCIIIVFSMLALLWAIVALFKFIAPKENTNQPAAKVEKAAPVAANPRKAISMEDIVDDDMMAAALVATIDYHEETGEDVRVVSIKEIK